MKNFVDFISFKTNAESRTKAEEYYKNDDEDEKDVDDGQECVSLRNEDLSSSPLSSASFTTPSSASNHHHAHHLQLNENHHLKPNRHLHRGRYSRNRYPPLSLQYFIQEYCLFQEKMTQRKLIGLLTIFVFLLIILMIGIIGLIYHPTTIQKMFEERVILKPDSSAFNEFQASNDLSVSYIKFYIFHVNNSEDILESRRLPVLTEKGPYVFRIKLSKTSINWNPDETLMSYLEKKEYIFDPRMSGPNLSLSDVLTVLNVPLITITTKVRKELNKFPAMFPAVFRGIVNRANEPLFLKINISSLLFNGQYSRFSKTIADVTKDYGNEIRLFSNDTFGILYGKNGSTERWTIKTGTDDIRKAWTVAEHNGQSNHSCWLGQTCNQFRGTDGTRFPPLVTDKQNLSVFTESIHRSLLFTYQNSSQVENVQTMRFNTPQTFFKAAASVSENRCYCPVQNADESQHCSTDGYFDVSGCEDGKPVVISSPHFATGQNSLREEYIGLEGKYEDHTSFLDIDSKTGVVLKFVRRLQTNLAIARFSNVKPLENLHTIFPLYWTEETRELNDKGFSHWKANKEETEASAKRLKILWTCMAIIGGICLTVPLVFYVIMVYVLKRQINGMRPDFVYEASGKL